MRCCLLLAALGVGRVSCPTHAFLPLLRRATVRVEVIAATCSHIHSPSRLSTSACHLAGAQDIGGLLR